MNSVKSFLTPAKVVEYLQSEIERCLRQKGIYKLSAYAFYFDKDNGEEKVNPDYTGIAKWHTNPRVEVVRASHEKTEINIKPTDEEVKLMWLATDAEQLLDNARLMIGQMLLVNKAMKEPSKDRTFMGQSVVKSTESNPLFWCHYNSSVIHLSMVSDRVRDLLLISLSSHGIDVSQYNRKDQNGYNPPYSNIFAAIRKILSKHGPTKFNGDKDYFDEIKKVAAKIRSYRRDRRNNIVHELGSELGRIERSIISGFQEADSNNTLYFREKPKTSVGERSVSDFPDNPCDHLLDECIDWYAKLITLSDFVFRVESALQDH